MKFKVGDRVKIVIPDPGCISDYRYLIGRTTTIESVDGPKSHPYYLKGVESVWCDNELEPARESVTEHSWVSRDYNYFASNPWSGTHKKAFTYMGVDFYTVKDWSLNGEKHEKFESAMRRIKDQLGFNEVRQTKVAGRIYQVDGFSPITIKEDNMSSSIVSKVKKLALTKDEKALREAGLKYDNGNWSVNAEELVMEKLLEENKDYLVDIAKKLNAENKD